MANGPYLQGRMKWDVMRSPPYTPKKFFLQPEDSRYKISILAGLGSCG